MTSYMSRTDVGYDDEDNDMDEKPRSRRTRRAKNGHDNSDDTGSRNGSITGDYNRDISNEVLLTSSDEDTPSPRKPSVGKVSSKSRDTLTPLKSPDSDTHEDTDEHIEFTEKTINGGDTEQTMNGGGDSLSKRHSLTKSNTVASSSDADGRRESYRGSRSNTESSSRRSSQRRTLSRNESVSEEEGNEQKSAAKLRAAWESRANSEHSKSFSRAKAVGGHTGASTLKARFENQSNQIYQRKNMSRSGSIHELDGDAAKKVSTSAIRARFEEKATESASPKRNFVINKGKAGEAAKKFNQGVTGSTKCLVCSKSVYPMEKLEVEGQLYHKFCFKCETCKRTLGLGNYASLEGKFYCKPHLKQLFALKGNYDEGFGREQRKADWRNKDAPTLQSSTPAAETMHQEKAETVEEPTSKQEEPEEPTELEESYEHDVNGHMNGNAEVEAYEEPPAQEEEDEEPEEEPIADDVEIDDDQHQPEHEAASASDEGIQNGGVSGEESDY